MVKVRQNLCPPSRYYLKCPFNREPQFYVVHNSANDAPAANEISYMINRPEEVSFHLAIDDKEVLQGLPFERNAWASGDGWGRGNMYGIHIEICYSLSGGPRFTTAEKNAAEYIAEGLKAHGWGIDHVFKHQDFDGKYCPHRTLDLGWQRFLNLIKSYLNEKVKEDDHMNKTEILNELGDKFIHRFEDLPEWAKKDMKELLVAGDINGGTPADVDPDDINMYLSDIKAILVTKRMMERMKKSA